MINSNEDLGHWYNCILLFARVVLSVGINIINHKRLEWWTPCLKLQPNKP